MQESSRKNGINYVHIYNLHATRVTGPDPSIIVGVGSGFLKGSIQFSGGSDPVFWRVRSGSLEGRIRFSGALDPDTDTVLFWIWSI